MDRHGKIQKVNMGQFASKEIAIYGSSCASIAKMVTLFQQQLSDYQIGYVDESHSETSPDQGLHLTIHGPASYMTSPSYTTFDRLNFLRQADLVLINGNHFTGQSQLIVYEEAKENSLIKRKDQLSQVLAFVGPKDVYERLLLQGFPLQDVPQYPSLDDVSLWPWIAKWMGQAPLVALLLSGGKSQRMGSDKSMMRHHGIPQYLHLKNICDALQLPVLLSCRKEQAPQYAWPQEDLIEDKMEDVGPLAGLISAWMRHPEQALLTIACDMPKLSANSLAQLIQQRNTSAIATTVCLPESGLPEPMLTIWEPKAYPLIMSAISLGISCPRKILQGANVHSVVAQYPEEIFNANTPQDLRSLHP